MALGYGTVVLQSARTRPGARLGRRLVRWIKSETPLAVTLSLGERDKAELARGAGRRRPLSARFETSNSGSTRESTPPGQAGPPTAWNSSSTWQSWLEVGSGVMTASPGQTYDDLARDIALFAELDLDMIGCGPYLVTPIPPGLPDNWPVLPATSRFPQ